jgi:hypothetical protein
MANVASVGMFGLSFIIWIANSLWIQELLKIQCLGSFQENL